MKRSQIYYEQNKPAYSLVMLFLALNAYVALVTLNNMAIGFRLGIYVLLTIIISLVSFLIAVKLKLYKKTGMYMCGLLIAVQTIRLFFLPELPENGFLMSVLMVVSIISLILALLVTIKKDQVRNVYLDKKMAEYNG
ncbi:hypothetical protein SAMN05421839_13020 [Halolactibacillus halophilus]|uniref:Uncharacterized protein n=1 Tax=Halolactibacillus halophilus TaxID=306540 RepID=A0A1I5RHK4_9BACI|nr:hypothetical protein [Halolactibacillus halophilus]GEM02360.1 hypothetical protein HHA03_18920 [Halolactibacillus halophilus]SFP58005.1 hypothetical protein SAMN05421839_13020 [Halolactibacillus halophilus]